MRDRQIHVVTRIISVSHRDNNNNNDDDNNNNNDDDDDDNNNNNNKNIYTVWYRHYLNM